MLTEEKEDYLKAILANDGDHQFVSNKQLSLYLEIKPPSVSEMVSRLERLDMWKLSRIKELNCLKKV